MTTASWLTGASSPPPGVSAGIDMALYGVARLFSVEESIATARHMQYDYRVPERWPAAAS